jgi:hypothetical protein
MSEQPTDNVVASTVGDKLSKPTNQTGQFFKIVKQVLERFVNVSTKTSISVPQRFAKGVDKGTVEKANYYKKFFVDLEEDIPEMPTPLGENPTEKDKKKFNLAIGKVEMYKECKKAYESDASELSILGLCFKAVESQREILGSEWVDTIEKEIDPPEVKAEN